MFCGDGNPDIEVKQDSFDVCNNSNLNIYHVEFSEIYNQDLTSIVLFYFNPSDPEHIHILQVPIDYNTCRFSKNQFILDIRKIDNNVVKPNYAFSTS